MNCLSEISISRKSRSRTSFARSLGLAKPVKPPGLGLLLVSLLGVPNISPCGGATIHVALTGNDAAAGTAAAPLRTLPAALLKTRDGTSPRIIFVGAGRYQLENTLELGVEDSGVQIQSEPGASPVLSGGRRLQGWQKDPS